MSPSAQLTLDLPDLDVVYVALLLLYVVGLIFSLICEQR